MQSTIESFLRGIAKKKLLQELKIQQETPTRQATDHKQLLDIW